jgi:hypothetical protein
MRDNNYSNRINKIRHTKHKIMFVFISLNADIPLRSRALVVGIICAKIFFGNTSFSCSFVANH